MDCSLSGSSVHGILQAGHLETTSWSGDVPDPGIKAGSPALQADSLPPELRGSRDQTPSQTVLNTHLLNDYISNQIAYLVLLNPFSIFETEWSI